MDSAGKKEGFAGPNLFIDMNIFKDDAPDWLAFSKHIAWSGRGMQGDFGQFKSLDSSSANAQNFAGIRDAFEIAETLSSNPRVLEVIRASRIGNLRNPQ